MTAGGGAVTGELAAEPSRRELRTRAVAGALVFVYVFWFVMLVSRVPDVFRRLGVKVVAGAVVLWALYKVVQRMVARMRGPLALDLVGWGPWEYAFVGNVFLVPAAWIADRRMVLGFIGVTTLLAVAGSFLDEGGRKSLPRVQGP